MFDIFSKASASEVDDEEKKKKKQGLIEALKSKYGNTDKGRIIKILKDKGSPALPEREIKK